MLTSIDIAQLQVWGHHGLFDEERVLGQKFSFDVRARLAAAPSHGDDSLAASAPYEKVVEEVVRVSDGVRYQTLEALAEAVARSLLNRFATMTEVAVRVAKMSPPIPHIVSQVAVEVAMDRSELAAAC